MGIDRSTTRRQGRLSMRGALIGKKSLLNHKLSKIKLKIYNTEKRIKSAVRENTILRFLNILLPPRGSFVIVKKSL